MEYTAENLEKAVGLFYRTEAVQQAEAHQWLSEAQNSPQAWSFVWELLHPQRNSEVQFFAATTLHTKLLKYWNEVPVDHYDVLKKRILESIVNFAMGPKIVLNRLCITLSAYIIHTVPTHWPKAFEELVSSFQPQYLPNVEPERVIWILLEILTVIPEEFQSTTLATSQRNRVRTVLQDVSKDILKVVDMCLVPIPNASFEMANLTTYLHSARCASAWIQLGGVNIDECSRIINLLVDLTCFVYWNRSDQDGMSAEEMELTETTLEAISSIIQHPHTHKYRTYVMKHTSNMLGNFTKILDVERTNPDPNKDILNNIYTLLVTTADTHCKIFIGNLKSTNDEDRKVTETLFQCILNCTDSPGAYPVDETCSTIAFGFWYTLQDDIISLGLDTVPCAELILHIKPYYRQLTQILLRKSMYPTTTPNSQWTLDDREMFRCYRQDVADTYMYCYATLNLEVLDLIQCRLVEGLRLCGTGGNGEQWPVVESCLHAFTAVAEHVELESLYLPKLMVTLKDIPYSTLNRRVLSSGLETIGAYSEWLADHPEILVHVMPLVVSSLGNVEVSPSATMALKELTHNCQKYLLPYADLILGNCQVALQDGNLKLAEFVRIMYVIGKVLSILPAGACMQYLNVVLPPSFQEIQSLLNLPPDSSTATRLVTRLKMLSSLFGSLHVTISPKENEQQPLLVVVQNTMPLYSLIGKKYCSNNDVMDVLWGLMKHVITTLLDDSKPILNDMLQLLVTVYREHPHPCLLHVAKTIAILFGKDEECSVLLQQVLAALVTATLAMCATAVTNGGGDTGSGVSDGRTGSVTGIGQLSERSDVLEAFYSMMAHVYRKVPHLAVASGFDTGALFECGVMCLAMPELQSLKYCTSFFVNFIVNSRETSQAAIVQNYGESLVMRVLLCLGGSSPKSSADILSEIFLVLNKKYCDNLARWLHTLLQQEGFPTNRVTSQQKETFIKQILREKANKRKLTESVMEFTLICRGILKVDTNAP